MRWVTRLLEVILVLVLVAVIAMGVVIWRAFPTVQGETIVAGLDEPSQVIRDEDGVPHITAVSVHDLFMTQGYVHAQDRFWQMDFWRHVSGGRLSEMFGQGQIESDTFLRSLGFHRLAQIEYDGADEEMRSILDAYSEGVNAYLAERSGASLSFEYAVVGIQNPDYEPEPWKPTDTLAWAKVMAWDLRASINEEIDRAVLSRTIPLEDLEELYPSFPSDHSVIVEDGLDAASGAPVARLGGSGIATLLGRIAAGVSRVDGVIGGGFDGIGSNNWVVSGDRTESGAPILANDPHLGIQMPSIWYENDLRCAEYSEECPYAVTGFSFAGVPGVVLGHNQQIAWGVTNEAPDSLDLYVERMDPSDPDRYEVNGQFVDMDVRTETIEVAGGEPVEIDVRSTRHGPVISGIFGPLDDVGEGGTVSLPNPYAITMRWTALEPAVGVFQAFLGLNRAENWDEFREALSTFDIAGQNFVYADADGHIGYQSTGRVPIRASGDGRYPVSGWTDEFEWTGFIPYDDMPRLFDPPSGMIVTANQPVVSTSDPRFIGADHDYGYRAERITELLDANPSLTVADMQAIQTDTFDASAELLVPLLLSIDSDDESVSSIQAVMTEWATGNMAFHLDAGSAGAAAWAATWSQLLQLTFDEFPGSHPADGGDRYFEVFRGLASRLDDPWWDRVSTVDRMESRDDVFVEAMEAASLDLIDRLGDDPGGWRWGDLHRATFENQSLGQSGIAPIEALFNRMSPPAVGGGSSIVNATGWTAPDGYEVDAVPSMRVVMDMGDLSRSVSVHTTGQSGHIFSGHYFDQNDLWVDGVAHPMRWTAEQIEAGTENVLRLVPS